MGLHAPRQRCQCARPYLPRSSALLLLALVLPSSSFAQLTTSLSQSTRVPTTLLTSLSRSPTSSSPPSITHLQSAPTQTPPPPSSTTTEESHAFSYYFLIIAGAIIIGSFCVLYIGRRKKRKAALLQTRGQRALARDIEGWRSRFGVGGTGIGRSGLGRGGAYHSNIHDIGAEDGLNERGEAPPPYVPGSKPPSISSEELQRPSTAASSHLRPESVELANIEPGSTTPPGYYEHSSRRSGDASPDASITRPAPVLTASERQASVRRPASSSGSLGHSS